MDAIQRAVIAPQVEIVEKCAARRQIFRDRTPLASRAQNIRDPVHHFAHLDMALVAAAVGGRDQWFDMRPFGRTLIMMCRHWATIRLGAFCIDKWKHRMAWYQNSSMCVNPPQRLAGLSRPPHWLRWRSRNA